MSRLLKVALGIFTSIGGFLEIGAIATTAQAGAAFGFSLIWAVVLGTICVIFLVEMSGRDGLTGLLEAGTAGPVWAGLPSVCRSTRRPFPCSCDPASLRREHPEISSPAYI